MLHRKKASSAAPDSFHLILAVLKLTTSHIRINYQPNYFSLTDEKVSNRRGFVAGTRDYLSPEIFSVQLTSSDDVMVEETREKNLTELTGKVRIGFLFTKKILMYVIK